MPSERAVSDMSPSGGTVFSFPTASAIGMRADVRAEEGHHLAEVAGRHQVHRLGAEHRAERAVERRGRAAALQVAEHADARLLAGPALDLG